jgi:hypothetical protein
MTISKAITTITKTPIVQVLFDVIENGVIKHEQRAITMLDMLDFTNQTKVNNRIDTGLVDALLLGNDIPFASGGAYVKHLNDNKPKGAPRIIKDDVKSTYDYFQLCSKIRAISTEPLAPRWNMYVASVNASNNAILLENVILRETEQKPKSLLRVRKPSVAGLLKALAEKSETSAEEKFAKYIISAFNTLPDCHGKKYALALDKIAAIMSDLDIGN